MGYLSEWEKSVNEQDGYSAAEKDTMMLSKETRRGLFITSMYTMKDIQYHVLNKDHACITKSHVHN